MEEIKEEQKNERKVKKDIDEKKGKNEIGRKSMMVVDWAGKRLGGRLRV